MKTPHLPRLVTAFAFSLLVACPSVSFAAAATPAAAKEKAAKLPLETSFAKEKTGDAAGLTTLTLKNTSARAVKVSATVELSVVVHNREKTRTVAAQTVEPGKTTKIEGLAAHDKVTVTADGFEPLLITVP